MIEYVLDTNVLSELMKVRPNTALEAALAQKRMACAIPAPVIDELQYGVSRMPVGVRRDLYQDWLEALMSDFPIIPLDGLCAQWHGRERARLAALGRRPPLQDGLIASVAVVNELILVTHNTKDFTHFSSIKLDDWYGPQSGV
jgi:tRNA(fMet)-specific endonuclease VapC